MLAPGTGIGGWYSDVVLSNQASMTSNVEVTAAGRHSQLWRTDPKFGPFSGWPAENSGVVSR
jgi:hypothetical protein